MSIAEEILNLHPDVRTAYGALQFAREQSASAFRLEQAAFDHFSNLVALYSSKN